VAVPTAGFIAMGAITGRPYGQDGGVVQLPLAIDRILGGRSPYGADYSDSMLGRQARVSDFWAEHGGNPILHHHAYLPGTHLLMIPFGPVGRALFGVFDPRMVTLLAFAAAGVLAFRLARDEALGLCAAAAVWVSPLVYWQQVFGANDVLVAALLLAAVACARASRAAWAAVLLGLACATKQLAWPFAPFLLAHLSGARTLAELVSAPARGRLARAAGIAGVVFAIVVLPVAALDFHAFWADIFVYNAGLPGGDNYPLGGTPGLGLANFLVYSGAVTSLRDYVPLSGLYLLLVPIGLWLLREQLRRGTAVDALVTGSAALLLSLYVSRVMHPNYLILAAVLLPAGVAAGAALGVDRLIGGLGLLALGVEIAEGEIFAATWADATAARWPAASSLASAVAPRAGPELTRDPLGLVFAALACGLGIVVLVTGVLRARRSVAVGVLAASIALLALVPAAIVMKVGSLSGRPRVQEAWAAAAWPARDGSVPDLREAWSTSFRKDPPAPWSARVATPSAPAAPLVARLSAALHVSDPRVLTLIALAVAAALMARTRAEGGPLPLAVLVLPPALVGVVFGSGTVLLIALIALAALAIERASGPRGALALVAALGLGLLLGGAGAWSAIGPGLGLPNLRLYAGTPPGTRDLAAPVLAAVLAVAASHIARRTAHDKTALLAWTAAFLTAALWLAPSVSPDDVAAPIVLLALAAAWKPGERFDSPRAAL
jgi:hypothetical protein